MINKQPILLLGLFDTAITTARCFPKNQFSIYGMDYKTELLGFFSNRIKAMEIPNPNVNEKASIDFINNWLAPVKQKVVIIPTSDEYVLFCSKNREFISKSAKYLIPNITTIADIIDRYQQFIIAKRAGLLVPKIFDINEVLKNHQPNYFPLALKPLNVNEWRNAFNNKGFIINNIEELEEVYKKVTNKSLGYVLQEMIIGENSNNFEVNSLYLPNGKLYQHSIRKIRQLPDRFGTATAIEETNNPIIEKYAENLIKELNFVGFSNIEFKFNEKDGNYYYIETNPRVWLQVNFSANIGLNLPIIYVNFFSDKNTANVAKIKNGKWVDFIPDLLFWLRYRKKYRTGLLKQIISWFPIKGTNLFSLTDLKPFILELMNK